MKQYYYSDGVSLFGPVTLEQLKKKNIQKETLVWHKGLDDWKPAKEIESLEGVFKVTPPPIPKIKPNTNEKLSQPFITYETKETPSPKNYYKQGMFSRPFSFEGRIRRTEYGISLLVYAILIVLLDTIIRSSSNLGFFVLGYIPLFWYLFAQGAKRCHDLGNSGWMQIIPLYVFWMLFQNGESGINKYGVNPKS